MWTESYGVLGRLAHHLPRDLASISPPVRRPPALLLLCPLFSLFFAVPAITFFCHSCPSRAEQGRARSASSRSSCATCPRSTTPSARPPQARDPHAPLPRGPLSELARWGDIFPPPCATGTPRATPRSARSAGGSSAGARRTSTATAATAAAAGSGRSGRAGSAGSAQRVRTRRGAPEGALQGAQERGVGCMSM